MVTQAGAERKTGVELKTVRCAKTVALSRNMYFCDPIFPNA